MGDVVRQGWLTKSPPPGVMKGWKRRFFRFCRATNSGRARLEYFTDTRELSKNNIKGLIDLSNCISISKSSSDPVKMKFIFKVQVTDRTYQLCCNNETEADDWVKDLCNHVFGNKEKEANLNRPAPTPVSRTGSANVQPAVSAGPAARVPPAIVPQRIVPKAQAPRSEPPPRSSVSFKRKPVVVAAAGKGQKLMNHHPEPSFISPWLYGKLSRHAAESLLRDYGTPEGLFLLRESSQPGAHAISVCFQGKIIHHILTQTANSTYLLNSTPCANCHSLDEVVSFLGQPRPELQWRTVLRVCPKQYSSPSAAASAAPAPVAGSAASMQRQPAAKSNTPSSRLNRPPKPVIVQSQQQKPIVQAQQPKPISEYVMPENPGDLYEICSSAKIKASPSCQVLGLAPDARCLIRVTESAIAIINSDTRVAVARWKLSSITQYGGTDTQFFFHVSQEPVGEFTFTVGNVHALLDFIETHSQQSAIAKPPPLGGASTSSKPMPPPITPSRSVAGVDANVMESMLQSQLAQAANPVMRKSPRMPAQTTAQPVSTPPRQVMPQPGLELDKIVNTRAALKPRAAPQQLVEDAPAPVRPPLVTPSLQAQPDVPVPPAMDQQEPVPPVVNRQAAPHVVAQKEAASPVVAEQEPVPPVVNRQAAPHVVARQEAAPPPLQARPLPTADDDDDDELGDSGDEQAEAAAALERKQEDIDEPDYHQAHDYELSAPGSLETTGGELWIAGCDFEDDSPGKLSFIEGDVLSIIIKDDGGWWFARLGSEEGWIPSDFVDPIPTPLIGGSTGTDTIIANSLAALSNASNLLAQDKTDTPAPADGDDDSDVEQYADMSDAFAPPVVYEQMALQGDQ